MWCSSTCPAVPAERPMLGAAEPPWSETLALEGAAGRSLCSRSVRAAAAGVGGCRPACAGSDLLCCPSGVSGDVTE